MSSTSAADRDAITAALDALEADFDVVASLPFNVLTNPERLAVLDRLETLSRRHPTMGHRLINLLSEQASPVELGGTSLANVLSTRLRVSGTDARRRIAASPRPRIWASAPRSPVNRYRRGYRTPRTPKRRARSAPNTCGSSGGSSHRCPARGLRDPAGRRGRPRADSQPIRSRTAPQGRRPACRPA